jgi:hypothetical protein
MISPLPRKIKYSVIGTITFMSLHVPENVGVPVIAMAMLQVQLTLATCAGTRMPCLPTRTVKVHPAQVDWVLPAWARPELLTACGTPPEPGLRVWGSGACGLWCRVKKSDSTPGGMRYISRACLQCQSHGPNSALPQERSKMLQFSFIMIERPIPCT